MRCNYEWQSEVEVNQMQVVDSDWAGCAVTRRSTSGGLMKLGTCTLKGSCAMSSAEAEVYAMTEGATRGLLSEMGVVLDAVHLYTDSSAAKSFMSQQD